MGSQKKWSPGNIGILGSGSWATALAKLLLSNHENINWYFRFRETVREFMADGHNPRYLSSVTFDTEKITFFTDVPKLVAQSDTLLLVTPSPYVKNILTKLKPSMLEGKFILNAVKGIVPEDNILITDYLAKNLNVPEEMMGVIGGPCHAEEVALERCSYLTLGCSHHLKAEALTKSFETPFVQCTTSTDVPGIEYASVLKNVYSIAAGICQGIRYGDNFQAVLVSNAIKEMQRFLDRVNPQERQINDSVYLGDLLVTAYSRYSRNRTFGTMIGKGYSVKQAQLEMEMVAEGYYGTNCIHQVNKKYAVPMPIAETIYQILYHRLEPKSAIRKLSYQLT